MTKRPGVRLIAVLATVAMTAAACGSDNSPDATTDTTAPPETSADTTAPPETSADTTAPPETALPRISRDGGRLVDDRGRTLLLRGVNMVSKTSQSPAEIGFGSDDAELIAASGFNAVRLGVIWASIEPEPGMYDDRYVDSISETIELLGRHGIYSLVDFHQDDFAESIGDGAPDWAVAPGGTSSPDCGFPLNLFTLPDGSPYAAARPPLTGDGNCRSDVRIAWDGFWANQELSGAGVQDRFIAMVGHVVERLAGNGSAILGYDLLNEPFPGTTWPECFAQYPALDLSGGCPEFDGGPLSDFYDRLIPEVHRADPLTIAWFESNVLTGLGAPVLLRSLGSDQDLIGLTFHNYDPLPPAYTAPVLAGLDYQQRHNVPILVGEFGATPDVAQVEAYQAVHDERMVSALYWAWNNNAPYRFSEQAGSTSASTDPSAQSVVRDLQAPLDGDNLNSALLLALTRVYPRAVAGTPESFVFDPVANAFHLEYLPSAAGGGGAQTEIVVPAARFPDGYSVAVDGGRVVSSPGAPVVLIEATGAGLVTVDVTAI
jgi:endoglycosylceramidase